MSIKQNLRRGLRAIEEAQDNLRRAKRDAPDDTYIRRAINELEDAESKIKKAIRELPDEDFS